MGFRGIAAQMPQAHISPIHIDAWVYYVIAIVLFVLMAWALAMFLSGVAGIWDYLRDRRNR